MGGELAKALVEAQARMPRVEKKGLNPHFKSEYVTLDDLIAATRPVLNQHGLAINQFPAVHETGNPVLVTRITHVSGESLEYAMPLAAGHANMQALGAAITYARRFAWAAALGIASDTDDDGNAASQPEQQQEKLISDAQRKRLFAIAKSKDVDADRLRAYVAFYTGSESTKEISVEKYDEIVKAIQADEDVPF